jgi:hypothetical protein
MNRPRGSLAIAAAAAGASFCLMVQPAAAETGYRPIDTSDRAAIVVHQREIPTWFGHVEAMADPNGHGGVTRAQICRDAAYDPPSRQGESMYELGRSRMLGSNVYQYASPAKAKAAWASVAAQMRSCSGRGSFAEDGATVQYAQSVRTLPSMLGSTGYQVSYYTVSSDPESAPGGWTVAMRQVGSVILEVRMGEYLARSVSTPPTTVPVSITSTTEVLVNRSALRYQALAHRR